MSFAALELNYHVRGGCFVSYQLFGFNILIVFYCSFGLLGNAGNKLATL